MSNYGPPGSPYPGQGQSPDPYSSQPDPYGPPSDPYRPQADPYGPQDPYQQQWAEGQPSSPYPAQSGYPGQPPYGGQPPQPTQSPSGYSQQGFAQPWAPTTAPPAKKSNAGLIGIIVALVVVLVCGACGVGAYLIGKDDDRKVSTDDSPSPSPSEASPTPSEEKSSAPSGAGDAMDAKVGDCFVNDGTASAPVLRTVTCGSGTYEVLKRFDGTSDTNVCLNVPGQTTQYFYRLPNNEEDSFVLCMKTR